MVIHGGEGLDLESKDITGEALDLEKEMITTDDQALMIEIITEGDALDHLNTEEKDQKLSYKLD